MALLRPCVVYWRGGMGRRVGAPSVLLSASLSLCPCPLASPVSSPDGLTRGAHVPRTGCLGGAPGLLPSLASLLHYLLHYLLPYLLPVHRTCILTTTYVSYTALGILDVEV